MAQNTEKITPEQWESTTFEGNRRAQLQAWAKMPFAKKIEWAEEAQRLATAFERARPLARPIVPSMSADVKSKP